MTNRIACLALLLAPNIAAAQPHHGGHAGGFGAPGYHGGMGAPGYHGGMGAPGYRGGLGAPGYRGSYSTFGAMGVPYYGGLGYPYGYPYGGITLGFGVGGLGYGYGMGSAYPGGFRYSSPAPLIIPRSAVPVTPIPASSEPAAAVVTLTVPSGAKVWFNDKEVDAPGGSAVFTSQVLKPGEASTLAVKARWNDRTREMNLTIRAGDKMSVDLRNN